MLPQLDVKFFCSQLFWLLVAFGLLYLYLCKFALPRLYDIFTIREKNLLEVKKNNERLLAKAQELEMKYQMKLNAIKIETSDILRKTEISLRKKFNLVKKENDYDFKNFMMEIEGQLIKSSETSEFDKLNKIDENEEICKANNTFDLKVNKLVKGKYGRKEVKGIEAGNSESKNGEAVNIPIEDKIAVNFLNRLNRNVSTKEKAGDNFAGSDLFLGTILFKKIFNSRL